MAIPLSIAFAIASGSTPIIGIYTAIIGGIVVSLIGGSKYNISGPAGAFICVIYNIIAHYGYNGLLISTFIAGLFLILFSIFKFGKYIKFIPNCIIIGFGLGLGFDILICQVPDLLGLQIHSGESFFTKIKIYLQHLNEFKISSFTLSCITIISVYLVRKICNKTNKNFPVFLIAIIISCILAILFGIKTETINSKFGTIHIDFPEFHKTILEEIEHPLHLFQFLTSSVSIAILSGIEALLSATIADKMKNTTHKPNNELFALGIANCISALFGCLPIAGTTARTIVNVKSGAKSSISGIFHGVFIIILIMLFANLISDVSMSIIAGVLLVVAVDMMSWKKVLNICKIHKSIFEKFDIFMLFLTAICVLLFGIVVAIIVNTIFYNISTKMMNRLMK